MSVASVHLPIAGLSTQRSSQVGAACNSLQTPRSETNPPMSARLGNQLSQQQQEIDELRQSLRRLAADASLMIVDIDGLRSEKQQLTADLINAKHELAVSRGQITELEAENRRVTFQLNNLQLETNRLASALDASKVRETQLRCQVSELDALRHEHVADAQRIMALREEVASSSVVRDELFSRIDIFRAESYQSISVNSARSREMGIKSRLVDLAAEVKQIRRETGSIRSLADIEKHNMELQRVANDVKATERQVVTSRGVVSDEKEFLDAFCAALYDLTNIAILLNSQEMSNIAMDDGGVAVGDDGANGRDEGDRAFSQGQSAGWMMQSEDGSPGRPSTVASTATDGHGSDGFFSSMRQKFLPRR
jgi:chromosome segregation ATPase